MKNTVNEEQEEAISADIERSKSRCLCPDCMAARLRLRHAGFRPCFVRFDVIGALDPDVVAGVIARDDDEAKTRAVKTLRKAYRDHPLVPLSVHWIA